jgi:hypothetical protein
MKTIIHINQHEIKANNKDNGNRPVITCKTYKSNTYAHEAIIYGQDGKEAARVVYSQNKPLSCGAKAWVETKNKVETIATPRVEEVDENQLKLFDKPKEQD